MTTTPRIELRALTRRLPSGGKQLTIVDRIDLSIDAGEFVAVLGPSGSGKSTLLGLIAGLDRPSEGEVILDGVAIQDLSEDALAILRRRSIGFVFQSFLLLGNLTALENELHRCWPPSALPRAVITTRRSFPAGSSSVSPWRARSARDLESYWPTNQRATWTTSRAGSSSIRWSRCDASAERRSCW
jgi:ABC-type Fe3+/spermidine/putrescine transport system ATPase subunit